MLPSVLEAVPRPHDAGGPVVEVVEQVLDALAVQRGEHNLLRRRLVGVGDQVAQVRVAVVADRGVQRHRVLRPAPQLGHTLDRNPHGVGELLDLRLGAALTGELACHVAHAVDVLDQVHRQPHGALLLGDSTADGLPDPPRGVRRELVASPVVELLHGAHQARVALLDQVQHGHPGTDVAARDRHHETQIRTDEAVFRVLALGDELLELAYLDPFRDLARLQQVLCVQAGFDRARQLDFLRGVEERRLRNFVQVDADQVSLFRDLVSSQHRRHVLHSRAPSDTCTAPRPCLCHNRRMRPLIPFQAGKTVTES